MKRDESPSERWKRIDGLCADIGTTAGLGFLFVVAFVVAVRVFGGAS